MLRVVLCTAALGLVAPAFAQTVTPSPAADPPIASAPQTAPATVATPRMTPAASTTESGYSGCGGWRTAELPTS